ncbi:DNA polymerase III subunit epsilon (plasmid) [Paracoccus sp. TK19116]|uniref:DNA polymerase III subunit epsilon n=1 Tax=Paracoccus albicereus TaxID=2922394 RepID=A0ABT1MNK0_9RHOB|nr:DNA polymerase III subunit epsilon [Paracoccus albicereus]MCQ0969334.1 DNA polymerase III subunit epsilon [Paracoccus albicereus]
MREILLDTETTGIDPDTGDRIVEIGAVELINHLPTDRHFHVYINPERPMPEEAFAVHGLGDDFLRDKPLFAAIADEFLDFIGPDSKLVIHNASFDMKFLNAELSRLRRPTLPWARAVDTLALARGKFPGAPASLDALCRRFGVDNSNRGLHGALLDARLLGEVYLELIGGRQPDLVLVPTAPRPQTGDLATSVQPGTSYRRPRPLPPRLTEAERVAHASFVERLGADALWRQRPG